MDRKPRVKVREDLRAQALEAERRRQDALEKEHEHAVDDLDALYDYSNAEHRPHPAPVAGRVSFRNVTFAYPLREKKTVLHGIDLEIRPGERTAIVGGACCGVVGFGFRLGSWVVDVSRAHHSRHTHARTNDRRERRGQVHADAAPDALLRYACILTT